MQSLVCIFVKETQIYQSGIDNIRFFFTPPITYRQFTTPPPPLKIANIIYGLLSGNYVNFNARVEIFGCLKSLGNSASSEPIKLQNSEKNPHERTQKKIITFQKLMLSNEYVIIVYN